MDIALISLTQPELQDEAIQVNGQGYSQRQRKEATVGLRNPAE